MSGQKTLLKISGCSVSTKGVVTVDSSAPKFEVLINPPSYSINSAILYVEEQAMGQAGHESKFYTMEAEKLKLPSLTFDGTGAVPGSKMPVKEQVALLRKCVYAYVGTKHEAPIVQVVWGSMIFYGRVKELDFNYTLFKPTGEPLRAKVDISFVEYASAGQLALEANRSSPDMTHLVQVRAGDTLPLLCERIYRDPSYYLEVARINGLTAFRQLEPGTSLRCPPLG